MINYYIFRIYENTGRLLKTNAFSTLEQLIEYKKFLKRNNVYDETTTHFALEGMGDFSTKENAEKYQNYKNEKFGNQNNVIEIILDEDLSKIEK